jgi:hypothetical protein
VGVDPSGTRPLRRAGKSPLHHELVQKRIAELRALIPVGGLREAALRGLLYVGMARGAVDERGFEALRRIRRSYGDMPLSEFKALAREQFFLLLIDPDAAVAAIPSMLPPDAEKRREAFDHIKQILSAIGELSTGDKERLQQLARLFGLEEGPQANRNLTVVSPAPQAKAS